MLRVSTNNIDQRHFQKENYPYWNQTNGYADRWQIILKTQKNKAMVFGKWIVLWF